MKNCSLSMDDKRIGVNWKVLKRIEPSVPVMVIVSSLDFSDDIKHHSATPCAPDLNCKIADRVSATS